MDQCPMSSSKQLFFFRMASLLVFVLIDDRNVLCNVWFLLWNCSTQPPSISHSSTKLSLSGTLPIWEDQIYLINFISTNTSTSPYVLQCYKFSVNYKQVSDKSVDCLSQY